MQCVQIECVVILSRIHTCSHVWSNCLGVCPFTAWTSSSSWRSSFYTTVLHGCICVYVVSRAYWPSQVPWKYLRLHAISDTGFLFLLEVVIHVLIMVNLTMLQRSKNIHESPSLPPKNMQNRSKYSFPNSYLQTEFYDSDFTDCFRLYIPWRFSEGECRCTAWIPHEEAPVYGLLQRPQPSESSLLD